VLIGFSVESTMSMAVQSMWTALALVRSSDAATEGCIGRNMQSWVDKRALSFTARREWTVSPYYVVQIRAAPGGTCWSCCGRV
jgi:hypothetical protein